MEKYFKNKFINGKNHISGYKIFRRKFVLLSQVDEDILNIDYINKKENFLFHHKSMSLGVKTLKVQKIVLNPVKPIKEIYLSSVEANTKIQKRKSYKYKIMIANIIKLKINFLPIRIVFKFFLLRVKIALLNFWL